ncbi:MAG: SelT/SelW/SelH family protein [Pseudarcicella sp.]|jgi:selenoprotein W-related protein|nr:SelT/SelW/SelH family protein [Pseudarcicella sp.]MBP6411161.1 SelT/SelW/SelH family protein [Pseudarcicella sp.]
MNKPKIIIEYCPKCGWLLRSAWLAQELLTTFQEELAEVTLRSSGTGGLFQITLDDIVVFDRKIAGHFPEAKEIKQIVRDAVFPEKSLGHSDKKTE